MIRPILTHLLALYLGAGLFGGVVMATHLPLSWLGVTYYTITWPEHIYCARPASNCAPVLSKFPPWAQEWFFTLPNQKEEAE